MDISFRRADRGPGWERWAIIENQTGDSAFAGELVMTYSDLSSYSEMECDVLFARELTEAEIDELLDKLGAILTGEGSVNIFSAHHLACRGFSLMEGELDDELAEEED